MGFYTSYELAISEDNPEIGLVIIDKLRTKNKEASMALDAFGYAQRITTWYDHEEDLMAFSLEYPDYLFLLNLLTEESEYVKKYFKAGKKQICKGIVTFEDYDEEKLRF